jgi:hypothetical protein
MKEHRQSTAATALMTLAAFATSAWASSAVADESATAAQEFGDKSYMYEVFRSQARAPGHEAALIAAVLTREDPDIMHSLIFLQTAGEGHVGKGIVCEHADPRLRRTIKEGESILSTDASLECHQHIRGLKETLTIGAIDSEFCNDLRQSIEDEVSNDSNKKDSLYSAGKKNPVATKEECDKMVPPRRCVCYDIKHEPPDPTDVPPNSGSGTGGHN